MDYPFSQSERDLIVEERFIKGTSLQTLSDRLGVPRAVIRSFEIKIMKSLRSTSK